MPVAIGNPVEIPQQFLDKLSCPLLVRGAHGQTVQKTVVMPQLQCRSWRFVSQIMEKSVEIIQLLRRGIDCGVSCHRSLENRESDSACATRSRSGRLRTQSGSIHAKVQIVQKTGDSVVQFWDGR